MLICDIGKQNCQNKGNDIGQFVIHANFQKNIETDNTDKSGYKTKNQIMDIHFKSSILPLQKNQ